MDPKQHGLLILNFQESLMADIHNAPGVLASTELLVRALQNFPCTTLLTALEGEGKVVGSILQALVEMRPIYEMDSFSALREWALREVILGLPLSRWVLVGLETHISLLQTAFDLQDEGKEVIVLSDCTSSRSLYDHESALEELRSCNIRVTSKETFIYQQLGDLRSPFLKQVTALTR